MNITNEMRVAAMEYKRRVAGAFILVDGAKLASKIGGHDICVTRKIDGVMRFIVFRDGEAAMFSTYGNDGAETVPCLTELAAQLKAAQVTSATVVAELYAPAAGGRPRCGDVAKMLAEDPAALRLAPFDLLELDGAEWKPAHYKETHAKLASLFNSDGVKPVEMRAAASIDDVQAIYDEWVTEQGAEGLVVHSELPMVWKIKPRHSLDAVVIGYTSGDNGIRDLIMAVRREDGLFQSFGVTSNGLSDEQRAELAARLGAIKVESNFIQTDSRGIAFQMIRPELVLEVSVNELVSESNAGKPKTNPLLKFEENSWRAQGMVNGVSAQGMSIERFREDKTPEPANIRIAQLTDLCPFAEGGCASMANLPKSTLLKRQVFRKVQKDKVMLQKFLLWKTNKESCGAYPAYVFHYTDYSSGRKDFLKRDIRVSDDEAQINAIYDAFLAENVKKGWEEVK